MNLPKVILRKLTNEDLNLVYKWRNDPKIRANMFNTRRISKSEHLRYWKKRLRKGNCYIITTLGKAIGFAKLDKTLEGYEVGIYIDPQEQGNGYGTLALNAVKKIAVSKRIKVLFARIKINNRASQKIFEKNGFKAKYAYLEFNS